MEIERFVSGEFRDLRVPLTTQSVGALGTVTLESGQSVDIAVRAGDQATLEAFLELLAAVDRDESSRWTVTPQFIEEP